MTKKAHPNNLSTRWLKLKVGLEADYLDALSEEEMAEELDQDLEAMSQLEQQRIGKGLDQLRTRIRNIVEAEQARILAYQQHGQRVAADHESADDGELRPARGYVPLARRFTIGSHSFGVGIATTRPREIVLLGELPEKAAALRIGGKRISLVATKDPHVHRCRDLGEPQLKSLLDVSPPPEIEIIVDTEKS